MSDAVMVTHPLSLTLSTVHDLSLVGYYALIICFPGMSTGTEGEWYSFVSSFFPAGKGSCLVWETTLLDHGDIPTGFGRIFGHRYIAQE